MAEKKVGKKVQQESAATTNTIFGFPIQSLLKFNDVRAAQSMKPPKNQSTARGNNSGDDLAGRIVLVSAEQSTSPTLAQLGLSSEQVTHWQWQRALKRRGESALILTSNGPLWLLHLSQSTPAGLRSHDGLLDSSSYSRARDLVGQASIVALDYGLASLDIESQSLTSEEQRGAIVGIELASYRFKGVRQPQARSSQPQQIRAIGFDSEQVEEATSVGIATNLARHLVNLPASDLNPTSYATALCDLFAGSKTLKVDVWQGPKLEEERCRLLQAVGRAAHEKSAMVRLSYRPKGKARLGKPLAFVGKGITFDTGGVDIKDADGMRLMKKDMGGSASLVGLALYLELRQLDIACDIYLALAENAIAGDAMRPGDIIEARNGQTVEIHNTDAEGRLVMADVIDFALTRPGADAPLTLINLATLTGAMRVALGTRLGGLFANDDELANQLLTAGQSAGDWCWRMPLMNDYQTQLKTVFADVANASPGRFGGAITAALFLQRFVGKARWAHIDMYAWTEGGVGALAEPGGNGQMVQGLAQFLRNL